VSKTIISLSWVEHEIANIFTFGFDNQLILLTIDEILIVYDTFHLERIDTVVWI